MNGRLSDDIVIDRETLFDIAISVAVLTCLILLVLAYEQTLDAFARFIRRQEGEIIYLYRELENAQWPGERHTGDAAGDGAAAAARDFGPATDC